MEQPVVFLSKNKQKPQPTNKQNKKQKASQISKMKVNMDLSSDWKKFEPDSSLFLLYKDSLYKKQTDKLLSHIVAQICANLCSSTAEYLKIIWLCRLLFWSLIEVQLKERPSIFRPKSVMTAALPCS